MTKTVLTKEEQERLDVFQEFFDLFIFDKISNKVETMKKAKNKQPDLINELSQKWSSLLLFCDKDLFYKINKINEEEIFELKYYDKDLPF